MALSVFLVLLLGGFEQGMFPQITAYADNTPADYYIGQEGVESLQGATSIIPREQILARAREVDGVVSAAPVLAQYSVIELDGEKVTTFMIGYSRPMAWWKIRSPRSRRTSPTRGPMCTWLRRVSAPFTRRLRRSH